MTMKELIAEATSLPVEERAIVADSILRSLGPPESEVDRKWAQVAHHRRGSAEMPCRGTDAWGLLVFCEFAKSARRNGPQGEPAARKDMHRNVML
jgi:hypothetical protein